MLPEMERRADRAATILAGIVGNPEVNVFSAHSREQALKLAVALAVELDREIIRSFNGGHE